MKDEIDCVRRIENTLSIQLTDRFDKEKYDASKFVKKVREESPKMKSLIDNILKIDNKDYKTDGILYKHFIYSELKGGYGAKLLTTLMKSLGYNLALKAVNNKIKLDDKVLDDPKNNYNNFVVLSSTALWNIPFDLKTAKQIINRFNDRRDNIHGKKIRFIIFDSAFKEGVDLFDVRYGHIFEQPLSEANFRQAIGRGLRYCGQKGLFFDQHKGWEVFIYVYQTYFKDKKGNKRSLIRYALSQSSGQVNKKDNLINDFLRSLQDVAVNKKY